MRQGVVSRHVWCVIHESAWSVCLNRDYGTSDFMVIVVIPFQNQKVKLLILTLTM